MKSVMCDLGLAFHNTAPHEAFQVRTVSAWRGGVLRVLQGSGTNTAGSTCMALICVWHDTAFQRDGTAEMSGLPL